MLRYAPQRHLWLVRETSVAGPTPPQPDDPTSLEGLADEIATLAAHIHAATQRLLELLAEFDRRRGWEVGGHRSCAHWLAFRTGIDLGAAREKVRAARALTELPETRAAMARGELSFSKVRALTRVATPDTEADLLAFARGCTTAQVERIVRAWKRGSRADEAEWERECWESRCLSVFPDDEGMYVVKGRLPAEVGALVMRAIEAASDALFRRESAGEEAERAGPGGDAELRRGHADRDTHREAARRRADAFGLLAERAMSAGFEQGGGRAERHQVVLHVSAETLSEEGEPDRSHLEDGTRVSAETSRRISCDAGLVEMRRGRQGTPVDVGRRTRTIPPALRRALDARDRGCRFPGCGVRFTDAHHVEHWADGGETSLGNCVLLCRHHHRLVHEGGWRVVWWGEGHPAFIDPRGGTHYEGRWTAPGGQDAAGGTPSADRLLADNRGRGVEPDALTASARWKRERDIPDPVYFRALEATA